MIKVQGGFDLAMTIKTGPMMHLDALSGALGIFLIAFYVFF